jgi:ABC-type polysaccharide/polyol phosphate transport system ATPase subunit
VAGERGVSRRLRLVEGERREAERVPDALIRRVRGAMIEVEGVSKSFGQTKALAGVDMSVPAGTVQGLLGPNGAGKTTLVRILATLLAPDAGRARISGVDVQKNPNTVRSLIGLAGQYAAVDETLTGRENLVMVGRLYRLGAKLAKARAGESLERLGLVEAADRPVKTYSGGMRRRLDLGASLRPGSRPDGGPAHPGCRRDRPGGPGTAAALARRRVPVPHRAEHRRRRRPRRPADHHPRTPQPSRSPA